MKYSQDGWLDHLTGAIPIDARRNQTSMYTIALEGWRRGLKLKFYSIFEDQKKKYRYSLSDERKTHHFAGSGGDLITEEAFEICENKDEAHLFLEKANVPIPLSATFGSESSNEEIIQFAKKTHYPLVIKPTNASSGKGVISNIKNETVLKEAIQYVRDVLGFDEIILQEYVDGDEVRIYVLKDKVLGATNRRPANVVGNGESTIKMLIDQKNKLRQAVPHLHFRPIKIDKEVKKLIHEKGYTIDSIPRAGERVYLRRISNVSKGGEPVDITNQLTAEQKDIAVRAAMAIPGLPHCGIDMMISNEDKLSGKIIEINTRPGLGSHLFPIEGEARDIPKAIVDYYFPESQQRNKKTSKLYFDFGTILNTLKNGTVVQLEVPPAKLENIEAVKYIVSTELELKRYYNWFRKQASINDFYGFIKELEQDKFEMVIAAENKDDIDQFKEKWRKVYGHRLNIEKEEQWEAPVKLCFELISDSNFLSTVELDIKLKELKKSVLSSEKENERLKRRIQLTEESKAWRVTKPIRMITGLLKRSQ